MNCGYLPHHHHHDISARIHSSTGEVLHGEMTEAVCIVSVMQHSPQSRQIMSLVQPSDTVHLSLIASQTDSPVRDRERKFKGGTADCFYGHKSPMSCLRSGTERVEDGREGEGQDDGDGAGGSSRSSTTDDYAAG